MKLNDPARLQAYIECENARIEFQIIQKGIGKILMEELMDGETALLVIDRINGLLQPAADRLISAEEAYRAIRSRLRSRRRRSRHLHHSLRSPRRRKKKTPVVVN